MLREVFITLKDIHDGSFYLVKSCVWRFELVLFKLYFLYQISVWTGLKDLLPRDLILVECQTKLLTQSKVFMEWKAVFFIGINFKWLQFVLHKYYKTIHATILLILLLGIVSCDYVLQLFIHKISLKEILVSLTQAKNISGMQHFVIQKALVWIDTAWKVSKYGVISGPYFPVFGLNTEI